MATAKKSAGSGDAFAFDAFSVAGPEAFKEGYEKFSNGVSKFLDFQKGAFEAAIASSGALAKGLEKAASEQAAFAKQAYEEGVAAAKSAAASKSLQDAFEVQTEYLRTAFEKNLAQYNKLTDHWLATAKEATQPLTERYGEFVELIQSYRP